VQARYSAGHRPASPPANANKTERRYIPPLDGLDPKAFSTMGQPELQTWQAAFEFGKELGFIKFPEHLWNPTWHPSDS
jgi:hypothetical protein